MEEIPLQKWSGHVVEVFDERSVFSAVVRDMTDETNPDEMADVYIEEVSPRQRDLIVPGAWFEWEVFYRDHSDMRERVSSIRFSTATWTEEEIEKAKKKAEKFYWFFSREE